MAEDRMYLTVAREKRKPQNDGYIAIISYGSPQLDDEQTTVLTLEVVKNMKEARKWFRQMKIERPWEPRS